MTTTPSTVGATRRASVLSFVARAVLVGAALLGLGGALVLRPDLHMVEQVRFEGNHRASVESLRHLADLPSGTRLWEVDPVVVANAVERHPWVRRAEVTRRLPATVEISVEEHAPVALIRWNGLRYVDRDGTIVMDARGDDLDYPILTGVDDELERLHPGLPALAIRDGLLLLDRVDERGLLAREDVSEVHFSRTRGYTLRLASGAELLLGLDGFERQLDRLATLQSQGLDLGLPVHVDLAPAKVAIVRPIAPRGEG